MNSLKLIILLIFLFFSSGKTQNVILKDGVVMGKRSTLIEECIINIKSKNPAENGINLDYSKYCECMINEVYTSLTSTEFVDATKNGTMADLMLRDDIFTIVQNCTFESAKLEDNYKYEKSHNYELQLKTGVKACVREIISSPETKGIFTVEFAEQYCSCIIPRIFEEGLTFGDLRKLELENAKAFDAILEPCINEIFDRK